MTCISILCLHYHIELGILYSASLSSKRYAQKGECHANPYFGYQR